MNYEINDVEKAKVGNKTAFENLYSAVYRDLYKFAFYTIGNSEQAKDAVSETFLEAYKGMRKYYGEENVIPFYIYVEPGERLSRAVERERRQENPKYTELCRRFIADEEDFSREKILEVGIDKIYENDKLFECVNNIENDIKKYL